MVLVTFYMIFEARFHKKCRRRKNMVANVVRKTGNNKNLHKFFNKPGVTGAILKLLLAIIDYPKKPTNSAIAPDNFEMLSRLNKLDLCRLFFLTE